MPRAVKDILSEEERWLQVIAAYERTFKKWESQCEKIVKRYRDDRPESAGGCRFNILWSNVQTLSAATFAKLPKADVSRRFRDSDPVGRVSSLILERALDYETDQYPDYGATMRASVLDRYLGGRATAWARYEPVMKQDDVQITEDVTDKGEEPGEVGETGEVVDYECAPTDYVHWRDFGHTLARSWEEVTAVWRRVYMTREALVARFGEEGEKVPLDAKPEEYKDKNDKTDDTDSRAVVYEIWDKETKEALWLSKSLKKFLDRRPDPLELEEFFPCPKPLYATLANDTLIPTPDFVLYQDQAAMLDTLAMRIEGMVEMLKVMGVYDASIPELKRLFNEGQNASLFPVKNWAAYAEKGKLPGAIELVDLEPIYGALKESYLAMEQIKNQIYEVTRISDIMRGYVNPREKLGQSELKSQYGNLGIKAYQDQVAEYATALLRLKAQIMCNKFSPQTLLVMSSAGQLSPHDQQLIPQAMLLLLGPRAMDPNAPAQNPLRSFRIEIAADSLINLNDQEEREERMKFLAANGKLLGESIAMIQAAGPLAAPVLPLIMELWKFGVQSFKVGKQIEGAFDEATDQLKKMAANPPKAQIPPEVVQQLEQEKQQVMQEAEKLKKQKEQQDKTSTDLALEKIQLDADKQIFEIEKKAAKDALNKDADYERKTIKLEADHEKTVGELEAKGRKLEDDYRKKELKDFEKSAGEKLTEAQQAVEKTPPATAKRMEETLASFVETSNRLQDNPVTDLDGIRDARGNLVGAIVKRKDGNSSRVNIRVPARQN